MKDTALLVVSFGTSYKETREKTIEAIERDLQTAFAQADVKRAFTSGMIIRRLRERDGMTVQTTEEAVAEIYRQGYRNLLVQPTHILNGDEYEKMIEMLKPYGDKFAQVVIGRPLLTEAQDYAQAVQILMEENRDLDEDTALVLMGHGTGHFADAAYAALDYRFKAMGYPQVFVGTVEGYPELADILPALKQSGYRKVRLRPFMIVAGDHAINDMAGDGESSWKNILESEGFCVECVLKGLGETEGIRRMYVEHLKREIE